MKIKHFIRKNFLYFLGALAVLYFFWYRPISPVVSVKKFDLFFGFLFMGYFSTIGMIDSWRYHSPQIVLPTFHSSLGVEPVNIIDHDIEYLVFRIGGFRFNGISDKGSDGVVCIPKSYVFNQSESYSGIAIPESVSLGNLPFSVQNYINFNHLPEPYLFCLIPSSDAFLEEINFNYKKDNVISIYSNAIKSLNSTIKQLTDVLKGRWDLIDNFNSKASNTSQSFNKTASIKERIFGGSK